MATQAKEALNKSTGKSSGGGSGTGTSNTTTRSVPSEPDPVKQIDKLDAIKYAKQEGLMDDKQANDAARGVVGGERLTEAGGPDISSDTSTFNIEDDIGPGKKNNLEDVRRLQSRLFELGYVWVRQDKNGVFGNQTKRALRLFQAIINGDKGKKGESRLCNIDKITEKYGVTGIVSVADITYFWLRAENAPRWQEMPEEGEGFENNQVKTQDKERFGTDWLADTIVKAGASYANDYRNSRLEVTKNNPYVPALLTANYTTAETGGCYYKHSTHGTGLDCDIRLPKTDGTASGGITWKNKNYDRNAMRAMLEALRAQPLCDKIFFNDEELIKEGLCEKHSNHDNHVHLSIKSPSLFQYGRFPKP